jgi:hypothetical protein
MRRWLAEALIRRVFSGQSDAKLTAAREALAHGGSAFPATEIAAKLRLPALTDEDIDQLLRTSYGGGAYAVLSLLYPSFPFDQQFDLDHIHPASFAGNKSKMAQYGLDAAATAYYAKHVNELPNLQLLRHEVNNEKRAKPIKSFGDV